MINLLLVREAAGFGLSLCFDSLQIFSGGRLKLHSSLVNTTLNKKIYMLV